MNKLSLYSTVIFDYRKTDLLTFKILFLKSLELQCQWDKINISRDTIRNNFNEVRFSTTDNDKSTLGSMNDIIWHAKGALADGMARIHFTEKGEIFDLNQIPMGALKYKFPNESFQELVGS